MITDTSAGIGMPRIDAAVDPSETTAPPTSRPPSNPSEGPTEHGYWYEGQAGRTWRSVCMTKYRSNGRP